MHQIVATGDNALDDRGGPAHDDLRRSEPDADLGWWDEFLFHVALSDWAGI